MLESLPKSVRLVFELQDLGPIGSRIGLGIGDSFLNPALPPRWRGDSRKPLDFPEIQTYPLKMGAMSLASSWGWWRIKRSKHMGKPWNSTLKRRYSIWRDKTSIMLTSLISSSESSSNFLSLI